MLCLPKIFLSNALPKKRNIEKNSNNKNFISHGYQKHRFCYLLYFVYNFNAILLLGDVKLANTISITVCTNLHLLRVKGSYCFKLQEKLHCVTGLSFIS